MTLRRRYYLAILPLFVGLGLLNSALIYYLERNELRWGLQEQSQGVAASIAGFWGAIAPDPTSDPAASLERYSKRLGGLSISWFEPTASSWLEKPLQRDPEIAAPPVPAAEVASQLSNGQLAWRYQEAAHKESDLSYGYAPVKDANGAVRAAIGVSERDTTLREAIAALERRLVILMLTLLLIGIGAAELITRIARRELGTLTLAAREAAHGRFLERSPQGRIRELNDLGGTLLTMTSLLADESHQTRRRFFQSEPLPDGDELAVSYRTHLEQSLPQALGPVRLSFRRLGAATVEDFCGWREAPAGWYLTIGRCQPEVLGTSALERIVRSEAARDFLLGVALSRPNGPTWPEALKAFSCAALQMVFIPRSGKLPTGWSLDPERGIPVPWTPTQDREVLGSLPAEALRIGQSYADQFPTRSLEQIADELSGLMGSRFAGLLVICDLKESKATA